MAVIMGRGYTATIGSTSITLTNDVGTATWSDSIGTIATLLGSGVGGLNTGNEHFLVMDFDRSSGSWVLQTSVDGLAFIPQGAANTNPTLAVSTADDDPTIQLSDVVSSAFVDDAVMYSGQTTFTDTELDNLFELGNTFGEAQSEYSGQFGAPICWSVSGVTPDGRAWRQAGPGDIPTTVRVPRGLKNVHMTEHGQSASTRLIEG